MRSHIFLGALLAAASVAAPLVAQDTERSPRDSFDIQLDSGLDRMMRIVMNRRARLGINVNIQSRDTDTLGAFVDAVSPSGPAAKAGIRSGDIITKLNGTSLLTRGPAQAGVDERQSLPGLRLIELAARLQPNDTVALEFLRGKQRRTVSVVTEDEPEIVLRGEPGGRPFSFRFFRPDGGREGFPMTAGDLHQQMDLLPPQLEFLTGTPLGRLELARLNPDLGAYFGASEGVLVISVPRESGLGLKGGDVVLAVDGRKPAGPSHLLRILRSYDRGETFKLDILRTRKRETVSARLGERE